MDKTQVKDLMTRNIVSVDLNENLDKIARLIVEKEIGSILVYNENKELFGIITKRDILARVLLECHNPCNFKAKDVASKNLITISPEKTIKEALMMMYKHKIRRIPVKDPKNGEIVGIITTHDLIAAYNYLQLPSI
jgi:CBS domain-containing protein